MKPTRQFKPPAPVALEERVVLSQVLVGGHATAAVRRHAAAQVAAAPTQFTANIADTIAVGLPVAEQRTTRFGGGSVQTESRLIRPDNINGSTLTTSNVALRNNGGVEQVTDFSYDAGYATTNHVITTTLPDGSLQTRNETLQAQGNTTLIHATEKLPGDNGGVRSIVGSTVKRGAVTITDETITDPDGTVTRDHTVVVHQGELRETETETKTVGKGRPQVTRSTTTIVRLQPPASAVIATTGTATPPTTNP